MSWFNRVFSNAPSMASLRKYVPAVLLAAIVLVSAVVVFRDGITIFGSWLLTMSAKKFLALGLFYLAALALIVFLDGRKWLILAALLVSAISLFSAKDDFYALRSDGDYSVNGNSYVYRNNAYLDDKAKIRGIKSGAKDIHAMWAGICAGFDAFCTNPRLSDFDKLQRVVFVVSAMFDFGNEGFDNSSKVGCAFISEKTGFTKLKASFAIYRTSLIGCCLDYARLTASFLNYLGLRNEYVSMPGHIANRVMIGGKWVYADSTSALIISGLFDPGAKTFYIYPNPNVDLTSRRFNALNFQRQEISYFSDNVHFITNYLTFQSTGDVDSRDLR